MERRLINVHQPVMYIPSLAIHLDPKRNKFECNYENELRPILATLAEKELNKDFKV